eukprot:COSAG02_NODE_18288_length_948_cov_0.825677_1_plen_70_part_00
MVLLVEMRSGLASYMQGEKEDAVSWYQRSLQTPDTSNQMCWNNMGIAMNDLGRKAEAEHSFARAKSLGR